MGFLNSVQNAHSFISPLTSLKGLVATVSFAQGSE